MTVQKRGLGRGLEALLVDVANKEATPTTALIQAIQAENTNLIKETEELKALLDDFEILVSNLNTDNKQ
jgi:hypothetical protein